MPSRGYERAVGAKLDTVVLATHNSVLESLAMLHDWLTRLHWAHEKEELWPVIGQHQLHRRPARQTNQHQRSHR